MKRAAPKPKPTTPARLSAAEVQLAVEEAVESLQSMASEEVRNGLARFGLPKEHALGVSMGDIQKLARTIGRSHELAHALWQTGITEARLLVCYVAEPERLTVREMDAWCADCDSWGIVDTLCFCLFDRTPLAWGRIEAWAKRKPEFEKRSAFALLACLALHLKKEPDARFLEYLPLLEAGAADDRNFVKKAVSWALRGIGGRSAEMRLATLALAERLAASREPGPRWIGKDVVRWLNRR